MTRLYMFFYVEVERMTSTTGNVLLVSGLLTVLVIQPLLALDTKKNTQF